jgi:predicted pyridoxine 5'-phosphate oxidase superfamily flavin-nucleotide-binding protein
MVRAFVMSNTDGNEITLPDGVKAVLNQGQGLNFAVPKVGKRIHADYPVQVHLLTAASRDSLTMRWYALLPHDQWSDSYLVPYGDARGCE